MNGLFIISSLLRMKLQCARKGSWTRKITPFQPLRIHTYELRKDVFQLPNDRTVEEIAIKPKTKSVSWRFCKAEPSLVVMYSADSPHTPRSSTTSNKDMSNSHFTATDPLFNTLQREQERHCRLPAAVRVHDRRSRPGVSGAKRERTRGERGPAGMQKNCLETAIHLESRDVGCGWNRRSQQAIRCPSPSPSPSPSRCQTTTPQFLPKPWFLVREVTEIMGAWVNLAARTGSLGLGYI